MNITRKYIGYGILIISAIFLGAFHLAWTATASQTAKPEDENYISYLGATWGTDGDTVYCIKQILAKTKTHDMLGNVQTRGCRLWFCKMKWDGSEKEEIGELWPDQGAFADTQSGPIWMEINAATSNIAFSVEYGNAASFGLWIMGLDGRNLHRPFPLVWNAQERWSPVHPSWNPDGTKFVFEEIERTTPQAKLRRLAIYVLQNKERRQLTDGSRDRHPVWSPKGDWIVYTHYLRDDRRIWLIRPDGTEQKPVVDEKGKTMFGWWPSWNSDGTKVSFDGDYILRIASISGGNVQKIDPLYIIGERGPWLLGGHHWGGRGWLLCAGRNIVFLDATTLKARMIGCGGIVSAEVSGATSEVSCWGVTPTDLQGKKRDD